MAVHPPPAAPVPASHPRRRSCRRTLLAGALALLVLAGCSSATSSPTSSAQPSSQDTPSATPSATPIAQTPYDGLWASRPLTRADLVAALARRDISDAGLDEWFPDWEEFDYRVFEFEVGNGRWVQYESPEGLFYGIAWAGDVVLADPGTIVVADDEVGCRVTYDISQEGETLSVRIADNACPDPDLAIQTAIYESSAFTLAQPAGWTPPEASFEPSASSSAAPGSEASTASTRYTIRPIGSVDGAPLGYTEYLPPNHGNEPSPLLVFLHGAGESGAGDEQSLSRLTVTGIPMLIADDRWPDARPFVVLSPQHEEVEPSYCLEAAEIDAFLRFALEQYDVDPSRVYLSGLSCGAIGLWNYLGAYGHELVAAAVPIAGNGIGAVQLPGCDLARLPIWAFHGEVDDVVPVRGSVYPITALQACTDLAPVDARLTVYPGGDHDSWTQTYESTRFNIYDWLLSHK